MVTARSADTESLFGLWELERQEAWVGDGLELGSFHFHIMDNGLFSYLGELVRDGEICCMVVGSGTWERTESTFSYVRYVPSRQTGKAEYRLGPDRLVLDPTPFLSGDDPVRNRKIRTVGYFVRSQKQVPHGLLHSDAQIAQGLKVLESRPGSGAVAHRFDQVRFRLREYEVSDEHSPLDELDAGEYERSVVLGSGHELEGVAAALLGMREGGYKKVRISPFLAYRNRHRDVIAEIWFEKYGHVRHSPGCRSPCSPTVRGLTNYRNWFEHLYLLDPSLLGKIHAIACAIY